MIRAVVGEHARARIVAAGFAARGVTGRVTGRFRVNGALLLYGYPILAIDSFPNSPQYVVVEA
jgi:hypothetical protein